MERVWSLFFDMRNLLAAAPLVYAFFSTRWQWEASWSVWVLASLLAVAGAAVRTWARCHCTYGRSARRALATTGPYAIMRNPLYVGNVLLIAAAAVASGSVPLLPVYILWACLIYGATIRHEERRLHTKYGAEYARYQARVPAWIPRRLATPASGLSLRQLAPVMTWQLICAFVGLVPFVIKDLEVLPF